MSFDCERIPGVSIERRLLVAGSVAAAAGWWLGARPALAARSGESRLDWSEFLERATAAASEIVDREQGETDEYAYALAALAVRLRGVPDTELFPFGKLEPKVSFAPSYRGKPFVVIQWRMEPGAVLPPHCHPSGSVCTLGIEGEARLQNYEIVGDAPSFTSTERLPFVVRRTHDEVLGPGRVNTLTPTRDNIHTFEAGPRGCRGIDITTLFAKDAGFSFLRFDSQPKDAGARTFAAEWIGQNP
jgi:quercetin dioxygenase-like cupin family protein